MEADLVNDFKDRMRNIAGEVGSQIAMSAVTAEPLSSGSRAYRAARTIAPRAAEEIRRATRASGASKHDLAEVAVLRKVAEGKKVFNGHMNGETPNASASDGRAEGRC